MNRMSVLWAAFLLTLCLIAAPAAAQVTAYTDEALFLADAANLGLCVDVEGFEDDAVWGGARTPSTASSVTNLGLNWLPNNPNSGLTTGGGPARTAVGAFTSCPTATSVTESAMAGSSSPEPRRTRRAGSVVARPRGRNSTSSSMGQWSSTSRATIR